MARTKSKTRRKKQAAKPKAKKGQLTPAARKLLKEIDAITSQDKKANAEMAALQQSIDCIREENDEVLQQRTLLNQQLNSREHMLPIFQALKGWKANVNGVQVVLPASEASPLLSLGPTESWSRIDVSAFSITEEGGSIRFEWTKSVTAGACGNSQEVICICALYRMSSGLVRTLKKFKLTLLLKVIVAERKRWLKKITKEDALMLRGKDA